MFSGFTKIYFHSQESSKKITKLFPTYFPNKQSSKKFFGNFTIQNFKCSATRSMDYLLPTHKSQKVPVQQEESSCPSTTIEPRLCPLPREDLHRQFLEDVLEIILQKAVFDGCQREGKVLEWNSPKDLKKKMNLSLPLTGVPHEKLLKIVEEIIQFSVKVGHPHFVNQLYGGLDPYGLAGHWLTDALNPSCYTYEVAPVFSLMEQKVLKKMRKIVGYADGGEDIGDGLFCPGGSIANGYAISCARHHFCPDIKAKGVHSCGRLVLFCSEDAHYSVTKMSSFMGIGASNAILVKTDDCGKMIPEELVKSIEKEKASKGIPFMVIATCGTTVLGAFDPVSQIAVICKKYNLWLHVDAAWGGGCLLSPKRKHLLKGIHLSDSVTWNPHKLLAAPQQCSVFLTKHSGLLKEVHSSSASYLFQPDKFYDTKYDSGDKHIQCGRKADVLKFWFMWKAKGTSGFGQHIDKIFSLAEYFKQQIDRRPDFKLVIPLPQCTNICFWYIPPSLTGKEGDSDFNKKLDKVAPIIKERMMKGGSMMITYQPHHTLPNFFRLVIINSGMETSDLDEFINIIARLGGDL